MAADIRKARAQKLAADKVRKYGVDSAISGRSNRKVPIYPTCSADLNYRLGIGGVPGNALTEVWGAPTLGKTTIMGFSVLRSVQAAGGLTAMIATEPDVEDEWMEQFGVNLDHHVTFRPDTGEEAYELLRDLVYDKAVDYILYDSLGGTSSAKEQTSEKPQAFGNASLNAWGIRNIVTRCWKNNIGVMFINQVRDKANQKGLPLLQPTGGHAVEHFMKVIIQLKPGADKTYAMVDGEKLVVGREIIASVVKNKAAQGLGKVSKFHFYHIDTPEYGLGIDRVTDVLSVAQVTNVVSGSGWLNHPSLPDGKIQGAPKTKEWLREHPEAVDQIEKDVMKVMKEREAEAERKARGETAAKKAAAK